MEDNRVLEAKKTTFSSRHEWCIILFLSLGELGICLQNLISTRGMEHWEKKNSPKGYAKIHQQRLSFDNRKDISKIIVLKIKTVSICIGASPTHRLLVSWKTSNPQFLVVFQNFPSYLSVGKFWQFWADSITLPMADNMPLYGLKTLKPHNS